MKTFKIGGVHPAENKLSASQSIKVAELPKVAVFPMGQHIGAPAKPIVQKGDKVKVYIESNARHFGIAIDETIIEQ